jgi:hypothetical protein
MSAKYEGTVPDRLTEAYATPFPGRVAAHELSGYITVRYIDSIYSPIGQEWR